MLSFNYVINYYNKMFIGDKIFAWAIFFGVASSIGAILVMYFEPSTLLYWIMPLVIWALGLLGMFVGALWPDSKVLKKVKKTITIKEDGIEGDYQVILAKIKDLRQETINWQVIYVSKKVNWLK